MSCAGRKSTAAHAYGRRFGAPLESPTILAHHEVDRRSYDDVDSCSRAERRIPEPLNCQGSAQDGQQSRRARTLYLAANVVYSAVPWTLREHMSGAAACRRKDQHAHAKMVMAGGGTRQDQWRRNLAGRRSTTHQRPQLESLHEIRGVGQSPPVWRSADNAPRLPNAITSLKNAGAHDIRRRWKTGEETDRRSPGPAARCPSRPRLADEQVSTEASDGGARQRRTFPYPVCEHTFLRRVSHPSGLAWKVEPHIVTMKSLVPCGAELGDDGNEEAREREKMQLTPTVISAAKLLKVGHCPVRRARRGG